MELTTESVRHRLLRDSLLLLILALHLSQFAFRGIVLHDEGLALLSCRGLLEDRRLFAEIPAFTLGGTDCVQVAVSRVLGTTLASQRCITLVADLVVAAATMALARRGIGAAWGPWIALAGCACALSYWHFTNYAHWSVAWVMVATALEWRSRRSGCALHAAVAGLSLAVAFWFKHNIALYAAGAIVLTQVLSLRTRSRLEGSSARTMIALVLGGLVGGGILCGSLLIQGTFMAMWNWVFNIGRIESFAQSHSTRLPSCLLLVVPPNDVRAAYRVYEAWDQYLPLLLVAASAVKLLGGGIRRRRWGLAEQDLLCCALVTLAVFANAYPYADRLHTMFALVPGSVLAGMLLPETVLGGSGFCRGIRHVVVALLIGFAIVHVVEPWVIFRRSTTPLWGVARGIRVPPDQARNLAKIQDLVDRHVPPGSPILCLQYMPLVYILLDRPTPFEGRTYAHARAMEGRGYVRRRLEANPPGIVIESIRRTPLDFADTEEEPLDLRPWLKERYVVAHEDGLMRVWALR